jgi:hypothetical protein
VGATRAARRPLGFGAFAAAAVLVVAAGVAITYLAATLRSTSDELGEQIRRVAALTERADSQERRLAERERQLDVVRDPYLRVTRLAPEAAGPSAEVLWSPTHKRGLMYARGLSKVPTDKTYELWLIAGGTPVPAGTFNVDEAGNAVLELPEIRQGASPDAFGVTVEPAGGSPIPTSPILLQGKYPAG